MNTQSEGVRHNRISVAVAIVSIAALGLTGCSSGNSGSSGTDGGKVTLTLLDHYDTPPQSTGLTALIAQWNKENPKIQVKQQVVYFDDLLTTMTVRQTGGQGADMVSAYALWGGQLASNGVLAKPPADVTADIKNSYSAAASTAVTDLGGQFYGYPTEFNTYALFYNKKLLAQAGYSAPPQNWDELKAMAKKLTTKDSSGNIKVEGISLVQDGDNPTAHPFMSLLNSAGGQFVDANGNFAKGNQAKAALQLESDLSASGATHPSILPTKVFPNDQVAMAIQADWWVGTLKTQMKDNYKKDVGVVNVPGPNTGEKGSLAYAFFMGVNARSKHQAQAWKFLTWLNSQKKSDGVTPMGAFVANMGAIPPRKTDAAILGPETTKADPNMIPFYEAANFAMAESSAANAYKAKTALHKNLMKMFVNHTPVEQTFASLVAEINAK